MTEFDKYIRQGEPDQKEKAAAWQVAIGLQDVDGLKPSEYLIQTAQQHIEGDISIDEVKHLIDTYYQSKSSRDEMENERTEEADKVSARITELLSEKLSHLLRIICCIFISACLKVFTSMPDKSVIIISPKKNGCSTEIR